MKRVPFGATSGVAALGLISATLLAGGCQNSMYEENAALHHQNRQLQTSLSATNDELQIRPTQAQVASLQQAVAERDRMIQELEARLNAPREDGSPGPDFGDGVTVGVDQYGNLTMDIAGDVLFASGSTKLNKAAEDTLARIADILKNDYSANAIRIEGHTDTDPISKTKNLYADNRDLSLQRAYSVTKFLEGKGLPPAKIETVGHGEHKPVGSNKAQNRRVVITVVKPA